MSIIQISKIQLRSGDLVDLPQLDEAELGFASDVSRLFIGKTSGNTENVEVLTAYSDISFSQIDGGFGNLDLSNVTNGQVLAFDGINWVNKGGNAGGYIDLGDPSNISISGGSVGYVLSTDGLGNLQWTPKGVVSINIENISASSTARVTLEQPFPFSVGTEVTINGIAGTGDFPDNMNGNIFYIKPVSGNLQLYDLYIDSAVSVPYDSSGFTPAYSNSGKLIFNTVSANGSGEPGGAINSVQFNTGAGFGGDALFTFNISTKIMSVPTVNASNINCTGLIGGNGAEFRGNIISTGANTTSGTITGNWTLGTGSKLQSTYADLAEFYCADKNYEPGTVLEFGGDQEVTLAKEESNRIAGVVSTNPAYVMNATLDCKENSLMIALIGRVPVKVKGAVSKGDMLVSAGQGFAKASIITPKIGTVIGKAISNKNDDSEGIVEVLVGRL